MATPTDIERISYGGPKGSLQVGVHNEIIQGVGATRTLLQKESGARCLFDRTAGNTYTLPVPVEGMRFDFFTTVSVTASDVHKVNTSGAAVFLMGAVTIGTIATASAGSFSANGTSVVGINMTATTKGGLLGSKFSVVALNTTQWMIEGYLIGSGTIVDPFI